MLQTVISAEQALTAAHFKLHCNEFMLQLNKSQSKTFLSFPKPTQLFMTSGGNRVRIHHALVGVRGLVCGVQQVAVLQLLTQPLQGVERLVELHGHGDLGQVFADVVPQDVPEAHAAGGAGGRQRGTPASDGHHAADWMGKVE